MRCRTAARQTFVPLSCSGNDAIGRKRKRLPALPLILPHISGHGNGGAGEGAGGKGQGARVRRQGTGGAAPPAAGGRHERSSWVPAKPERAAPLFSVCRGRPLGAENKARAAGERRVVERPQGGKKPLTRAFGRLIMEVTKWVRRRKTHRGKKEGVAP